MPTSSNRVAIEIFVDDQGSVRVREFADKTGAALGDMEEKNRTVTQRIKGGWDKVKASWVGITATIVSMREAWGLMNMAARARQEEVAFENLAASYGTSGKAVVAALKEASGETIATMDLIRDAGTAMMMGIAPDKVTELMEIARATSKMTGQTVSRAFNDIALAVGRQSRMILDNLGIIVDVEQANADYAASLGKTSAQLTDAERKQAFMNATLAAGGALVEKLGNQHDTAADRLERLRATTADLKVMVGDGLTRAYMGLLSVLYTVEAGVMTLLEAEFNMIMVAAKATDFLRITSGAADEWRIKAEAAKESAIDFAGRATQNFKDMIAVNEQAVTAQKKHKQAIEASTKAVEKQATAEKKLVEQQKKVVADAKKAAAEQARVTEEMYKEAGLGADRYYEAEAAKLVEKAAKWEAAGADQLAVEEWLYDELGKLSEEAWGRGQEAASLYLDTVQVQSRTLVDEFNEMQRSASAAIEEVAGKAAALDGTEIGLVANFDGTAVMQGLDQLIAKFRALQAAADAAAATPPAADYDGYGLVPEPTAGSASFAPAGGVTNININQQLSRADVVNLTNEQRRRSYRS